LLSLDAVAFSDGRNVKAAIAETKHKISNLCFLGRVLTT